MTVDELKSVVKDAIREELSACGILATTAEQRVKSQGDFDFLRRIHLLWDGVVNKVGTAVLIALLGVAATAIGIIKFGR
jgi:hypothetical protein